MTHTHEGSGVFTLERELSDSIYQTFVNWVDGKPDIEQEDPQVAEQLYIEAKQGLVKLSQALKEVLVELEKLEHNKAHIREIGQLAHLFLTITNPLPPVPNEEEAVAAFRASWYESDTEEGRRKEEELDDIEKAVEDFRRALREVQAGRTYPISTLWDDIEDDDE